MELPENVQNLELGVKKMLKIYNGCIQPSFNPLTNMYDYSIGCSTCHVTHTLTKLYTVPMHCYKLAYNFTTL